MNKELIELQKGISSVCTLIPDSEYEKLGVSLYMDSAIPDMYLFGSQPIFKDKLEELSKIKNIAYFVIRNIDLLNETEQNKYIGLVKDREISGYNIPDNVIIVFTVKDKEGLKKVSRELYHFSVVAF